MRQPPFSRRELALIGAFWFAYAFLVVANRLLGPLARGEAFDVNWRAIVPVFIEYLCWALLTPPIFWLASRADSEKLRAPQIALLAAVGVVVALVMSIVALELRNTLVLVAPGRLRPPPLASQSVRGMLRPLWFGFINAIVISMGVLAAGIARAYSIRYRERHEHATRLQAQLAESRLDALRRQLDPHFLFNTLNAISSLVERDPRGVRRMIARLSDLLRFSLDGADRPEVSLREELAMLEPYLDIVRLRFQGRLAVETHIDERTLGVMVPSLILQPLVENAIKHGIEKLPGQGHVVIEAGLDGSSVVIRVRDNGPRGSDGAPSGTSTGVGIRNTVERLAQLYGADGGFTLRALDGKGTEAEVRVPARGVS